MSTEHDQAVLNSILNPGLPLGDVAEFEDAIEEEDVTDGYDTAEVARLERSAICAADRDDLDTALELINTAVEKFPRRASVYNNRAQLYRLLRRDHQALLDADRALELSGGRGLVARQALCQRALLHQLSGKQEQAKDDYTRAANMGSTYAKTQLVAMNPYAALCNRMLGQVMDKLRRGEMGDEKL